MSTATTAEEPQEFTIDCKGDLTGRDWHGKFKAKPVLSHRDRMARDRLRREYLGVNADEANAEAKATAQVLSELAVRLVAWPEFWAVFEMGENLKDLNLLSDVYKAALKIEDDYMAGLVKKAEDAKKTAQGKAAEIDRPEKG